jgi:cytochrome c oxidase subunit 3
MSDATQDVARQRALDVQTAECGAYAPARTGVWVGIAGVFTMFAALTSAAIVRQGSADDWEHVALPAIVYANTAILFASSVALEVARRKVRGGNSAAGFRWMAASVLLGVLFVAGQVVAWTELRARGVELATAPSDAFFYVLTGMHAFFVVGGMGGLLRVMRSHTLLRSTIDGAAYYWHFMAVLWACLLLLLWMRF